MSPKPRDIEMYCKLHKRHHRHHHLGCARRSPSTMSSATSSSDDSDSGLSRVELFKKKADAIKASRSDLQQLFPKEVFYPNKNDMEWCSFTCGYRICAEIYGEKTDGEKAIYYRRLPYRRFPLLSIVVHLPQPIVKVVLRYLHQWFLLKGMKNVISMWMYSLLAVLETEDVDDVRDRFLQNLYKDCKVYLNSTCEDWQRPRVTLIMDILQDYFDLDSSDSDSE